MLAFIFFFNDTATTEIYTLSLHDALPISIFGPRSGMHEMLIYGVSFDLVGKQPIVLLKTADGNKRSEEHTSELQSQSNLVCRLLLEKKNDNTVRGVNISQA